MKKMEIPLVFVNNLPTLPVELNGKIVSFLLDSGASSSVVDSTLRKKHNFIMLAEVDSITGIGGARRVYGVKDIILRYRDKILKVPKLKTSDLSEVRRAIGVSGILGSDFLMANLAHVNFKSRSVTINTI